MNDAHTPLGAEIRALRKKGKMTRIQFASALGISEHTLKGWESGNRNPDGAARTLLQLIQKNPQIFEEARALSVEG